LELRGEDRKFSRGRRKKGMEQSAEDFKLQGNELYKKGDYKGAIELYSKAIDASPTTGAFYGNRAAASFMLGKHEDVITDCNRAIVFDPTFFKGYIRKSKAQLALVRNLHSIKYYMEK
jgi:tetratricopeptide (TPR) repeat protein